MGSRAGSAVGSAMGSALNAALGSSFGSGPSQRAALERGAPDPWAGVPVDTDFKYSPSPQPPGEDYW